MEFISLDQEKIVRDRSRIKKVSGCAGSRKTDTMIKCGIHSLENAKKEHQACLFLTLVGSVTDEITERLQNYLKIPIEKQGISNHYMGEWKGHVIEIANYDAFIHRQLQEHEDSELFSTDFDKKAVRLLEHLRSGKHPHFYLKNGRKATLILVDEFQDISPVRAEILIEFFKTSSSKNTKLVVMGDMLQTIFPQALSDMKHPLIMIDELRPTDFRLKTCYRCPKSHLDVVNCITRMFRVKYGIPEMKHHFELPGNRPFFFTHDATSNNTGSLETAKTVHQMIVTLSCEDPSIRYKDIVVIMKRSNHQLVFHHLMRLFARNRQADNCMLSRTRTYFNEHQPINWKEGKERLMMLSIHGDKGKGHPVVFFLGFSGGTIPEERHFHKMEELLSQSLLNVALTRATKYLFVGMTRTYPSFYFYQAYNDLRNLAYFSWRPEEITHPLFRKLVSEDNSEAPVIHRCNIRKEMLMTPIKNIVFVHQDDKARLVLKKPALTKHRLGSPIRGKHSEEELIILHGIAKLYFIKMIKPRLLVSILNAFLFCHQTKDILFTDDENLLCQVKDSHLNHYVLRDASYWFSVVRKLSALPDTPRPIFILHEVFRKTLFQHVVDFIQKPLPTIMEQGAVPVLDAWNTCIFFMECIDDRAPNLRFYYDHASPGIGEDVLRILENIRGYVSFFKEEYSEKTSLKKFRFQQKSSLIGNLVTKEELESIGFQEDLESDKRFFSDGYKFGVSSTIDFLDMTHQVLIEFRTHNKNECLESWQYQALLNAMFSMTKIRHIHIFNVLRGMLYTCHVSAKKHAVEPLLEPFLTQYEFHPILIEKLRKQLEETLSTNILSTES
jgi:hypothetical protein